MSEPRAYYNDTNRQAAATLRELIARGLIAPGVVDERDIREVRATELAGFRQCHFFAGFGVWSYAARRAGWPDRRPLWTASLPCQPWSAAGQGKGVEDERHLWPVFQSLRAARRPIVAIGEQVASPDGLTWLDLVQTDVEAPGDAFGAVDLCSAGFGAPHIRQRLHWVAYTDGVRRPGVCWCREGRTAEYCEACRLADATSGGCGEFGDALVARGSGHADGGFVAGGMGNAHGERAGWNARAGLGAEGGPTVRTERDAHIPSGATGGLADTKGSGSGTGFRDSGPSEQRRPVAANHCGNGGPRPTNGFWSAADWLPFRDDKWRPVEPGTFPLAHGAPARVGRLRGYGNAINAEVATAFIEAVMDHLDSERLAA